MLLNNDIAEEIDVYKKSKEIMKSARILEKANALGDHNYEHAYHKLEALYHQLCPVPESEWDSYLYKCMILQDAIRQYALYRLVEDSLDYCQ